MTTTLKVSYESGNGAIEVTKPNGEVVTLETVGAFTEVHIHQGDDQQAVIKEVAFANQAGGSGGEAEQEGEDDNG